MRSKGSNICWTVDGRHGGRSGFVAVLGEDKKGVSNAIRRLYIKRLYLSVMPVAEEESN